MRHALKQQANLQADETSQELPFDDLMAALFTLVTHHSLTGCEKSLMPIVDSLNRLVHHSEIELYPNQLSVLAKMRQLWQTKLFEVQIGQLHH